MTRHGNSEGQNILEFVGDMEQRPAMAEARLKLCNVREKRVHPGRTEKVLTSWNGLMLAAYVCDAPVPGHAFACQAPVAVPEELRAQPEPR